MSGGGLASSNPLPIYFLTLQQIQYIAMKTSSGSVFLAAASAQRLLSVSSDLASTAGVGPAIIPTTSSSVSYLVATYEQLSTADASIRTSSPLTTTEDSGAVLNSSQDETSIGTASSAQSTSLATTTARATLLTTTGDSPGFSDAVDAQAAIKYGLFRTSTSATLPTSSASSKGLTTELSTLAPTYTQVSPPTPPLYSPVSQTLTPSPGQPHHSDQCQLAEPACDESSGVVSLPNASLPADVTSIAFIQQSLIYIEAITTSSDCANETVTSALVHSSLPPMSPASEAPFTPTTTMSTHEHYTSKTHLLIPSPAVSIPCDISSLPPGPSPLLLTDTAITATSQHMETSTTACSEGTTSSQIESVQVLTTPLTTTSCTSTATSTPTSTNTLHSTQPTHETPGITPSTTTEHLTETTSCPESTSAQSTTTTSTSLQTSSDPPTTSSTRSEVTTAASKPTITRTITPIKHTDTVPSNTRTTMTTTSTREGFTQGSGTADPELFAGNASRAFVSSWNSCMLVVGMVVWLS